MNVIAIIQARMGSTRFPGKVLHSIGGKTMLSRVVNRVCRSSLIDKIVVATSVKPEDDPIFDASQKLGVNVFRGSEEDVLDRYYQASRIFPSDAVVRITSDCPLIDPNLIDEVIHAFQVHKPDYASNTLIRTYPRGLDTEVMSRDALERSWKAATKPFERIHVTPFIYQNPELFVLFPVTAENDFSNYRWTVDTQADMDFIQTIYARFHYKDSFGWKDVLEMLSRETHLSEMNRDVRQKTLEEG